MAKGDAGGGRLGRGPGGRERRVALVGEEAGPAAGQLGRLRNGLLAMIGQ